VVQGEPGEELVHEVESGVRRPSEGRVMSLSLDVVFAAADVNRCGAVKTGDAVASVKVEPEVAHLQGHQF
jgi:microcystin degradation protein MlrC